MNTQLPISLLKSLGSIYTLYPFIDNGIVSIHMKFYIIMA